MHTVRHSEMAIPRMFDSNMPFVIMTGGSELSFLSKEEDSEMIEEEKDTLVQDIGPHLSRVMQQGTAKHVHAGEGGESEEEPCVSIVAQAEREDFQEFSPTNTKCPYTRFQLLKKHRSPMKEAVLMSDTDDEDVPHTWFNLQRKQCSRSSRPSLEGGEERPIIRGLWVQEIRLTSGSTTLISSSTEIVPPPPGFTDSVSCSCADVCKCVMSEDADNTSSGNDGEGSDLEQDSVCTDESESSSSSRAEGGTPEFRVRDETSALTLDLMLVSGSSSGTKQGSDSVQSLLGVSDATSSAAVNTSQDAPGLDKGNDGTVLDVRRGQVMQIEKQMASAFFRDLMKQTQSDRRDNKHLNEGLIFHHQLQPSCSQYREEQEYCVLYHIQSGSYGDVFCIQDKRTGFQCAAKRIPLNHFSSEEVSTWSALNSPRVVELFGAVREGLNIVLFMDLKPACLAQLLKEMNSLPEDLALHYLHQTLGALEHLHRRQIVHLDVKVDNVLLSADCRDTFLCDFGLSETLDDNGWSMKAFRGSALPGTETHMAPEVAQGDRLSAKADVWSSCCMLLHMLNGCHPWTRYYSHPLCLQIVNEPPPLWEVPSNCNNFTAKVFRAGLQKDTERRASAKKLRKKSTKALRAVGGLSLRSIRNAWEKLYAGSSWTEDAPCCSSPGISLPEPSAMVHWVSPWRTAAVHEDDGDFESKTTPLESQHRSLQDGSAAGDNDWDSSSDSEVDIYVGEEEFIQERWLKADRDYEGDWEEEEESDEEDGEWDSSVSTGYRCDLRGLFPLLQKGQQVKSWGSESALEELRDDVPVGTTIQTPSPEPRDDPPSCFSCSDASQTDASDKESDRSSDDLSSGVFSSCNSHTDTFVEWSANQQSCRCLEGVDVWIENVRGGECLRIRERRQVKVGHVAIGISDQVSGKAFTLETLDRKSVAFDQEITESCVWLCCVPAPDRCQRWRWRVRDGRLELRE